MNKDKVFNYIHKQKPNLIINCAGKVGGIAANINNNFEFLDENITINRNVILAGYANRVKYLINFGSSCMYPAEGKNNKTEIM